MGMDAHALDVSILLDAPLLGHMAVKNVTPPNGGLFANQFVVAPRVSSLVNGLVQKP
jgi:hypothetical protein